MTEVIEEPKENRKFRTSIGDLTEWVRWTKDGSEKFVKELTEVTRRMKNPPVEHVEASARLRDSLSRIREELSKMERDLKRSIRTGGS